MVLNLFCTSLLSRCNEISNDKRVLKEKDVEADEVSAAHFVKESLAFKMVNHLKAFYLNWPKKDTLEKIC